MKKQTTFIILLTCLFSTLFVDASDKILIMTHVYCRPDFIELQAKTFKAFLKDDYEYVVFNDAPNETMCNKIKQTCNKFGIKCITIPQEIHINRDTPNYRCADVIQYSLNKLGFEFNG